jgi:hypothetical protein
MASIRFIQAAACLGMLVALVLLSDVQTVRTERKVMLQRNELQLYDRTSVRRSVNGLDSTDHEGEDIHLNGSEEEEQEEQGREMKEVRSASALDDDELALEENRENRINQATEMSLDDAVYGKDIKALTGDEEDDTMSSIESLNNDENDDEQVHDAADSNVTALHWKQINAVSNATDSHDDLVVSSDEESRAQKDFDDELAGDSTSNATQQVSPNNTSDDVHISSSPTVLESIEERIETEKTSEQQKVNPDDGEHENADEENLFVEDVEKVNVESEDSNNATKDSQSSEENAEDLKQSIHNSKESNMVSNEVRDERKAEACLSRACFEEEGRKLARVWREKKKEEWCVEGRGPLRDKNAQTDAGWQGLLLVKTPKCASTTVAGIVLRIADRYDCANQHNHLEALRFTNRTQHSFMLSSVRHPEKRAMSGIFFFIYSNSPDSVPTDDHVQKMLNVHGVTASQGMGGFQLKYMTVDGIPSFDVTKNREATTVHNKTRALEHVEKTLSHYNFVIVTERMDESLVALAMLTGLELEDVIVTSSKLAGDYFLKNVGKNRGRCIKSRSAFVSNATRAYLDSDSWLAKNYGDYIMHAAVNQSLDLTIESLGKIRFDRSLADYKKMKNHVLDTCGAKLSLGCTPEGERIEGNACYFQDMGCGYKCVDETIKAMEGTGTDEVTGRHRAM